EKGTLFPGHVEGRTEAVFSRRDGFFIRSLEQQFALHATKFGYTPMLSVAVRLRERVFNRRERFSDPLIARHSLCQNAEEPGIVPLSSRRGIPIECGAQQAGFSSEFPA